MAFGDIPIRQNGFDHIVDASWWNTIRTELVNAFGSGAYIFVQSTQSIINGGTITLEPAAFKPFVPVVGDGGPVNLNTIPFTFLHERKNGAEIVLMGTDDINTVTISHNDNDEGFILNGATAVLKKWHKISFIYLENLKRFVELERNF